MPTGLTLFQITYLPNEQSEETLTPLMQFLVSPMTMSNCLAAFVTAYEPFRVLDMKEIGPAYLIEEAE
jgi:hypothetical protein